MILPGTQAPHTNILLHLLLSPNYEIAMVICSAESCICLVGTGRRRSGVLLEARLTPSDQTIYSYGNSLCSGSVTIHSYLGLEDLNFKVNSCFISSSFLAFVFTASSILF